MTARDSGSTYLDELRRFLAFLNSLWGILGGISVFFPLSNALIEGGIPLAMWDEGALAFLRPELINTVTTLVVVFVVFWTYGQRDRVIVQDAPRVRRAAVWSFALGLVSLILYMIVYALMKNDFHYNVMGWNSDDLRRLIFDVVLLMLYVGFFSWVTRAFLLLATSEYFKRGATPS